MTTPFPPPELMNRVGQLNASDPTGEYDRVGKQCHDNIVSALPAGSSLEGRRVLDFGCGAGRALRHFIPEAGHGEFWGCDVHAPSIEWINANLQPPLQAVTNDTAPPLPFDDEHFDLVYALSVFTHLADDWSEWLVEMHRLLKPDGILLATICNAPIFDMFVEMGQTYLGDEWDEDRLGLFVTHFGLPQDKVGPVVYHSEWWIREHWGRAFDILDLQRWGFAPATSGERAGQGWVVMRKRPVPVDTAMFEAPGDSARELEAVRANLEYTQREMSYWRQLAVIAGAEHDRVRAHADGLEYRLQVLEASRGWRALERVRAARRQVGL